LQHQAQFDSLREHELILNHYEPLTRISIYRSILQTNQASVLEDVNMVPAWTNHDTPPYTRSWMGIPLIYLNETLGILSLSRVTFSPFSNHEKETALVFARYLSKLLSNLSGRIDKMRAIEKKKSIWCIALIRK
jgi:GAF domain-containing protein